MQILNRFVTEDEFVVDGIGVANDKGDDIALFELEGFGFEARVVDVDDDFGMAGRSRIDASSQQERDEGESEAGSKSHRFEAMIRSVATKMSTPASPATIHTHNGGGSAGTVVLARAKPASTGEGTVPSKPMARS